MSLRIAAYLRAAENSLRLIYFYCLHLGVYPIKTVLFKIKYISNININKQTKNPIPLNRSKIIITIPQPHPRGGNQKALPKKLWLCKLWE